MPTQGHKTKVRIRTSSGLGTDADNLEGCNEASLNRVRDELESTQFGDNDKKFVVGLKGKEIPFSGYYEAGGTVQTRLEDGWNNGTNVFAVLLWNGTAGHNVECIVPQLDIGSTTGELVKLSGKLTATGAVSAV